MLLWSALDAIRERAKMYGKVSQGPKMSVHNGPGERDNDAR